ncbi:SH3 domain-containing protein [Brevundimonas aveniformis]|uniref:SH3 domain-containing protein n=1 Tax=Brevundimonas aveniformis TaxID=370977 RepID=UPI00040451C0|nr:SH3 domain-containing protein [Brevundimonas aveniformis]
MSFTRSLTLGLSALSMSVVAVPTLASAQDRPVGVLQCEAPGNQQERNAVIGGAIGALVGSQISDNERTLGAVAGAAIGAGAGSYIGCEQQRREAERNGYAQSYGNAYATANVNVRSGPGTEYGRVGSLSSGQAFQAGERLGDWVGVVENGRIVGYVHGGYVRGY